MNEEECRGEFLHFIVASDLHCEEDLNPKKEAEPEEVFNILETWSHLFAGLGKTNRIQHGIDTGDATPIRGASYPVAQAHLQEAQSSIKDMLVKGIIVPSRSEWNSPVVPVRKKDRGMRIAMDYRKLNSVSKKDAFPMPRVDEVISKLGKAKIFSTLDFKQGYYQIEMKNADREKTAFRVQGQLYPFTRMPFGLSSAPQTFVWLMDAMFGNLDFVECYVDDLIVFSGSVSEHLVHLEKIFERISKYGQKCTFVNERVEFLGYNVGGGEARPLRHKVSAILNFLSPVSWKEMSRFLGLCGYYRNLIPDYGRITGPLYDLHKKGKKFVWSDQCESALQRSRKQKG